MDHTILRRGVFNCNILKHKSAEFYPYCLQTLSLHFIRLKQHVQKKGMKHTLLIYSV